MKVIIFLASILAYSLWNCTERIDVKVDTSFTRLVVEGYVTTDTTSHWVRLSTTSDYFFNQPAPSVSKAILTIDDGKIVHDLRESDTIPGMYFTAQDFHGIPGRTYTLNIRNLDVNQDGTMEEYTAASELRPVNPVDSIALRYFDAFDNSGYEVQIYAWDSPAKDWYSFKVHKNGILLTDSLTDLVIQNDDFFNGNYTNGITVQFLNNNEKEEKVEIGDTINFEINGITEDYYNFIMEAQSQVFPQIPLFSGPPANIRTNLNNDAIGFFAAYSVNYCSTIATADVVNGGIQE